MGVSNDPLELRFQLLIVKQGNSCLLLSAIPHLIILKDALALPCLPNLIVTVIDMSDQSGEARSLIRLWLARIDGFRPLSGRFSLSALHNRHLLFKCFCQLLK